MAEAITDEALIALLTRGDKSALSGLYVRHAPHLLAMGVYMLADKTMAEEVLHEVFLEAWRRVEDYDPTRGTVRGWLMVRMSSRCLDAARERARRASDTIEDHPELAQPQGNDKLFLDNNRLHVALATLPADQRDAISACYLEDVTTQEAALRFACPQGTLKSRLRLGLRALRTALEAGSR